ncbi:MAG: site-specific integrase, partial [Flavobacteriales bacterium]|nr:site-specific integrase [Flavobacteriales bacterium]
FTDSGLRHLTSELRKVCNIDFTIHRLRHTFATLMIEGGCDIYSLSKMMGHSDISTTTIYLSTTTEHLRGQIMKHPLNR